LRRAPRTWEIRRIVDDFASATAMPVDAGFDGVEIHAASGYLVDQFLRDGTISERIAMAVRSRIGPAFYWK